MTLILVTGASGSGKSTLCDNLAKMYGAIIIPQDSFYKVPYTNTPTTNVEGAEIIDWKGLCETVVKMMSVIDIAIIVEGHVTFTCDILVDLADLLVFVDPGKDIVKRRFMNRRADDYTLEQLDKKEKYFEEYTWPSHERYVKNVVSNVINSDYDKLLKVGCSTSRSTDEILNFLYMLHST